MQLSSDLNQQAELRRRQVHQLVARTKEPSPLDSAQFQEACLDKLNKLASMVESMQSTVTAPVPLSLEQRLAELEQEFDRVKSQMRDLSCRLDGIRFTGVSAEEEAAAEKVLLSLNNLVASLPGPVQADLPAKDQQSDSAQG